MKYIHTLFLATALFLGGALAQAGDLEDALKAAQSGDFKTAFELWKPLAEQGDAIAQYNLGVAYDNGEGVPEDDAEAARWYRKAAEQGDVYAQLNLGFMYVKGEGVPEDDAEAVRWYRKAAEQGDAYAQLNLGVMYANGEGVSQSYVLAHMWNNVASANGFEKGREYREMLEKLMTPADISKAQAKARICMESNYQDCD